MSALAKLVGIVGVGALSVLFFTEIGGLAIHQLSLSAAELSVDAGLALPARGLRWLAADVFPMRGVMCGNAYFDDEVSLLLVEARVLALSAERDAALRLLLPRAAAGGGFSLSNDRPLEDLALSLLREDFSPEELRIISEDALSTIRHLGPNPDQYVLTFAGVHVPFYHEPLSGASRADEVRTQRFFALALGNGAASPADQVTH